jgi:UDP-N-acetylbacillosamine N-acetyltransferase
MGSTLQRLVIWGASGHALVVADILRLRGEYVLAGYIDSVRPERLGDSFGGATVLGGEEQLKELRDTGVDNLALGVGDCSARLKLADIALDLGFDLVTVIHPSAIVADSASIGAGSVLCAGSVVNPMVTLGRCVIVNTCASVDHECVLGEGVHVSPGVHLAGNVIVGKATAIGIGSSVRDRVSIGEACTIGAGSVVVSDLPAGVTAYGVPARIKNRTN